MTKLSKRETDIVRLLCDGASNKQIAAQLSLTVGTVKDYMHTLFKKCGAPNRTALAIMFLEKEYRHASKVVDRRPRDRRVRANIATVSTGNHRIGRGARARPDESE